MASFLVNPFKGTGLASGQVSADEKYGANLPMLPSDDEAAVARLLALCPAHRQTDLLCLTALADQIGVKAIYAKDERSRMGLGSFKALGASYAIAKKAADHVQGNCWNTALEGHVFVAASAGNHGLSVAAGAKIFGAKAVIYLADTVPEAFAERLRAKGAQVVRHGADYEASMDGAMDGAKDNNWQLLSDSSWPNYTELPFLVMEGYVQMAAEAAAQISTPPTHILVQAGVGGMAAAIAAFARKTWGSAPQIIVVEPDAAPALMESVRAGKCVTSTGPVSAMGRLDCKTPSMIALAGLARDADLFCTISETEAAHGVNVLAQHAIATTPSGGAGIAALLARLPGVGKDSQILAFISEGPELG